MASELLPCRHHASNIDVALESNTTFCRLCDLQSRCRDAETNEKELHEKYVGVCKLVADMHAAAMGKVTGPRFGPVEDVKELKARYDSMIERHGKLREAIQKAHSFFSSITFTANIIDDAEGCIDFLGNTIDSDCEEQAYADLAASGGIVGVP